MTAIRLIPPARCAHRFIEAVRFDVVFNHCVNNDELARVRFGDYVIRAPDGATSSFRFTHTGFARDELSLDRAHVCSYGLDPTSSCLPSIEAMRTRDLVAIDIGVGCRETFDIDRIESLAFKFHGVVTPVDASLETMFSINNAIKHRL